MRIVDVVVIDLTRAVEQAGFKSVALLDFTKEHEKEIIFDTKSLKSSDKGFYDMASAYFANGGNSLLVAGKKIASKDEIDGFINEVLEDNPCYIIMAVVPKANQKEYYDVLNKYAGGNEKLMVLEVNGTADEVIQVADGTNSDRLVLYANANDNQLGLASAVVGVCAPQDEGSITWGNKAVTGVPVSGYKASDEQKLLMKNINYITKEKGLVISQMGRTTSGSNADITRTKDWLKNRCAESLTSALINAKKIAYTDAGLTTISATLNTVGAQAVGMGMLDKYQAIVPSVADIPTNDKANRILRGVKFIATLSGAVETIELELPVKLA